MEAEGLPEPDFSIEQLGERRFPSPLQRIMEVRYRSDNECLLVQPEFDCRIEPDHAPAAAATMELAGPRAQVFFDTGRVRAAIVTCGGLCPGLNAVIRGLVMQLWYLYDCRQVLGIRFGYQGLGNAAQESIMLTPARVSAINGRGGTILGSSRGTPPTAELVDNLERRGIDMLFVIGGDGSMRGGTALWEEIRRRRLQIAVVGIPKTIDNDIPWVRRTFGFDTAVAEAVKAINAAEVEANGMPHGIGLVKLMGRAAGFIAATACVASGNANACLIPEVPFQLEGPNGLLALLEKRLHERNHAVVVVAEGAGQHLVAGQGTDASGNPHLGDIGACLKQRITEHFHSRNLRCAMKYIEPSYLIRAAAPNASDQLYCDQLARAAVHAAMAGKGGLLIGNWNGRLVHIPMQALKGRTSQVNPHGELWFSVLENTGQPRLLD
ncbi:MAG: ATP-dependent 6-phosphofructokinase [Thiothrix sp.]|nr:ATP-dependent 6-phosphofructokinase [Thiothrix sp.]HPQ96448.1 ATP-dependent 6-phosphofructokinase [Thiolinea sp.]